MNIIEIAPLKNGAHRNQKSNSILCPPKGWAVVPDDMDTANFPFGEITVEEIDGVMTVTSWTAGIMPEVETIESISEIEQLRADVDYISIMTGVEL